MKLNAVMGFVAAAAALFAGCGRGLNTGTGLSPATELPPFAWSGTRQYGVPGDSAYGDGIAVNALGDVFVTGYATGGFDEATRLGVQDCYLIRYREGVRQWTKFFGATGVFVQCYAAAADAEGNVYVAGQADGVFNGVSAAEPPGGFVFKVDSSGTAVWTRFLGATGFTTSIQDVAVNSAGVVFVTGDTNGSLPGNAVTGTGDYFVASYDQEGNRLWVRQAGVGGVGSYGRGVAVDGSGNAYVAGFTDGNLHGVGKTGNRDAHLSKYDSSGTRVWTQLLGAGGNNARALSVATDGDGNAVIAGYTDGSLPGNTVVGADDLFFARFDSSGSRQWVVQRGSALQSVNANAVTVGSDGAIYVTGVAYGGFNGGTVTGSSDVFLLKYDAAGSEIWSRFKGVENKVTVGYGVAVDLRGHTYLTGYTRGGLDGNAPIGAFDAFVASYDSSGTAR